MRTSWLVAASAILLIITAAAVTAQSEVQQPDAVHVTGVHSLGQMLSPGSQTVTPDGVRHVRGLEAIGIDEFSDPRLSGETHIVHGEDVYPGGLGPRWGTAVMENEGGTWSGAYVAWVLPRDDGLDIPIYTTLLEGQGGYEGLSALCQSTYPEGRGWDGESECVLFPGPIPRLVLPS